ncbi:MAG: OmpA family protein [Deltaproteobacteria bacterium]|nr:OmpA family protein [Deltaproteobacteria bacterium]
MRKAFHPIMGALFLLVVLCSGVSAKMPLGERTIDSNMNLAWKFDFGGLFDQETPASSLSLPVAPTEISASAVSDSLIKVSWNAVSKAANYRIYRDGKYLTANPATHLSDSGLNGATRHCYHVTSVDAAGKESEQSKQACATTLETPKAALGPLVLTATASSETQINLSWNPVDGALGYKVYRDGLYLMTSTAATSVPDKDLREAGRYCYQVTAVDTTGKESEKSNQACAEGTEQVFAFKKMDATAAASVSKEMLEKGRVQIDIEFDYNKYDVKPRYHQELKKIGDVMAANPELKMVIEGHTDNVGGKGYNMNLSARRAEAVRAYIIEHFGVKKTHLTSKGYGMSKPIASNKTAAGRQKNRRVEAAVEYTIKK